MNFLLGIIIGVAVSSAFWAWVIHTVGGTDADQDLL